MNQTGLPIEAYAALEAALIAASSSPCQKSRRGAAVFANSAPMTRLRAADVLGIGFNHLAFGACVGGAWCRLHCNKRCVHAEQMAIRNAIATRGQSHFGLCADLIHIKVDAGGDPLPSGGPSCWQCARDVLAAGLAAVWLYHENGNQPTWHRYVADDFHRRTMVACDMAPPPHPDQCGCPEHVHVHTCRWWSP